MPLPPALAARLARRGIVERPRPPDPPEEVLAEDYAKPSQIEEEHEDLYSAEESQYIGHPGCPNKWNVYHCCQLYCRTRWGLGQERPEARYLELHRKLVRRFPPGPEWREKFDPGTGRFFFWSVANQRVSWLPPGHPKAVVTEPASKIREMLANRVCNEDEDDDDEEEEEEEEMDLDSANESDDEDCGSRRRPRDVRPNRGQGQQALNSNREPLDPMDPSAYSDAPRGKWSRGLEKAREQP